MSSNSNKPPATAAAIWVTPLNDGEAVEIAKLLRSHGETVLTTGQGWGATWAGLEPEIQAELRRAQQSAGTVIYGVELGGANPYGAVNIDHHRYGDDDRWQPLSSLEQVAARLGVKLARWATLVALNDRGYIPAMIKEGGASADEVAAVRLADRQAQGLTAEQELAAERDVEGRAEYSHGGQRVKVECPQGCTAAHSDRLYGKAREILLVSPDEWNYYGPAHRELAEMMMRQGDRKTWCGGAAESGYFGIAEPDEGAQAELLRWWADSC